MGKPIPWYPMLPWWSLPLPSFYPYIKTLVKLRLPDFPPEDLEATQPKNLVNAPPASPSSPQTSSRHSFRFRFGDDWNYTISIKDSKSATHCHCQQKTPRHVYIYMCIYIHIDIYTYTRKKTYAPLHYIYSNITFNMQMLFSKKNTKKTMTSKQWLTLVTFQYNNPLLYITL